MSQIAAIWAFVLSVALITVLHLLIDLDALYGPGGVKSVTAISEGRFQRDWITWLIACFLPLFNNDIVFTSRFVSALGVGLASSGATLLSIACHGRRHALWIASILSVSLPVCWLGVLIGGDAPAMGFGLFGVGLAALAVKKGNWNLLLIPIALLSSYFAIQLKTTALPLIAIYVAMPCLLRSSISSMLWILTPIGVGILAIATGYTNYPSWLNPNVVILNSKLFLNSIATLTPVWLIGTYGFLFLLLRPKKSFPAILYSLVCLGTIGATIAALEDKYRVRYILPLILPLMAVSFGAILKWATSLNRMGIQTRTSLALVVPSILLIIVSADSLNFFHDWKRLIQHKENHEIHRFYRTPNILNWSHDWISDLDHSDHSLIGANDLYRRTQTLPEAGIGTVPLRDGREFHVRAYASLKDNPYRILTSDNCCRKSESKKECAIRIVDAFENTGALLVLPNLGKDDQRIPIEHKNWARELQKAAAPRVGWKSEHFWNYYQGQLNGFGELPCSDRRAMKRRQKQRGR